MDTQSIKIVMLGSQEEMPHDQNLPLLWRCLHSGPLSAANIDAPEPHPQVDWPAFRQRNTRLLQKLAEVYGAYAVAALDGEQIVGHMRFYPRAIWQLNGSDYFCMQQFPPNGPALDLADRALPPFEALSDRTLSIHCMMVGSAGNQGRPYRRTGIAHRMAGRLVDWARQRGWRALETAAFEDLDLLYAITGLAGRSFWEKLGFQVISVGSEPAFAENSEFGDTLRRQAAALGLPEGAFTNKYLLHLDL